MWKVLPVETCVVEVTKVETINLSGVHHAPETLMRVPIISYVLKNEETGLNVLVDPGISECHIKTGTRHRIIVSEQHRQVRECLKKMSFSFVVVSHLHTSCASAMIDLAGSSKIFVQREEMRYAVAPYPIEKTYYDFCAEDDYMPFFVQCYHQFVFLDGVAKLADGLSVIPFPGHSPGFQCVVVKGEKHVFLLGGDLLFTRENIEKKLPPSIRTDTHMAIQSIEKILRMRCIILPGHDPIVFDLVK